MMKNNKTELNVLGVMSGTSLDGLDLALSRFNGSDHEVLFTKFIPYSKQQQSWLKSLYDAKGDRLQHAHLEYGKFLGETVKKLIREEKLAVDLIASHGHTIFHEPRKGFTFQLGQGQAIAQEAMVRTVADFRTQDVLLGGEGAPLVPIGDELLYNQYDACLNMGGISNISFNDGKKRRAFDISPCNYLINRFARELGQDYDENGDIARSNEPISDLTERLNSLEIYSDKSNPSWSTELIMRAIEPLLMPFMTQEEKLISTFTHHAAQKIAETLNSIKKNGEVLLTGGGTYNKYLIKLIKDQTDWKLVIPDKELIDFKEAIVFGLMGYLRVKNEINVYASATGAQKDHITGVVYDEA